MDAFGARNAHTPTQQRMNLIKNVCLCLYMLKIKKFLINQTQSDTLAQRSSNCEIEDGMEKKKKKTLIASGQEIWAQIILRKKKEFQAGTNDARG